MPASISGRVFNDLDGDAAIDVGEPGLVGRTVFADLNDNGQLDRAWSDVIEPDDFRDGDRINSATPGVLLTSVGGNNAVLGSVTASAGSAFTGTLVFGHDGVGFWNDSRRFRAEFERPVSRVSITFLGGSPFALDVGRMDAFDRNGNLVATAITPGVANNASAPLSVSRSQGDIFSVVAYSPAGQGSFGRLDQLNFTYDVTEPSTTTDTSGNYSLVVPDTGTYDVRLAPHASAGQIAPFTPLHADIESYVIPVANATDARFDPVRRILYTAGSDGLVQRFDVDARHLLEPLAVGLSLSGVDVSADGQFVYAGENEAGQTYGFVRRVETATGNVTNIPWRRTDSESGVADLALLGSNSLLFTPGFSICCTTRLHETNLGTLQTQIVTDHPGPLAGGRPSLSAAGRLARSANRRHAVITHSSGFVGGQVLYYDSATDRWEDALNTGTSLSGAFSAINRTGGLVAVSSSAYGLRILDGSLDPVRTLPAYVSGVVFHPQRDVLYAADDRTDAIYAYDTTTWSQTTTIPLGFDLGASAARGLTISDDGNLLFLTTASDVRAYVLAAPTGHPTSPGQSTTNRNFALAALVEPPVAQADALRVTKGSAGNVLDVLANDRGRGLTIASITAGSAGGALAIHAGDVVTYSPRAEFEGVETFGYTARDVEGRTTTAQVQVAVQIARVPGQVTGLVFDDVDGDGIHEPTANEPGLTGESLGLSIVGGPLLDGLAYGVEPDDYSSVSLRNLLNLVHPLVRLSSTGTDNVPIPLFVVTSNALTGSSQASTGDQVFGSANVAFWNFSRRLRADFATPMSAVSLDFIGGVFSSAEFGRLEAFDSQDRLIGTYVTNGLLVNEAETMTVRSATANIAYVVASSPQGQGTFGRLDNLRFGSAPLGRATSAAGAWTLTNVPPGSYDVTLQLPAEAQQSTPLTGDSHRWLSFADRRDIVFDPVRGLLYVSRANGNIERYDPRTDTLLAPLVTGTALNGIDVTPDGRFLVAARATPLNGQGAVLKVDATTGAVTTFTYDFASVFENGAFDVAVVSNTRAFVTAVGGNVPMRQIDLNSGAALQRTDAPASGTNGRLDPQSRLTRSLDRRVMFVSEKMSSAANFSNVYFRYDASSDRFGPRETASNSAFDLPSVALTRDGAQVALETSYGGLAVYDSQFAPRQILPHYSGGIAFHPSRNWLYAADTAANEIVLLDLSSQRELARFAAGEDLTDSGHMDAYVSDDGRWLFLTTPTGVRAYDVLTPGTTRVTVKSGETTTAAPFGVRRDRPPVAVGESFTVVEDRTLVVNAPGVLGNDSDPDNSDADPSNDNVLTAVRRDGPANGQLTFTANGSFTYVPTANFAGRDTFTYVVNGGLIDSSPATVTIDVTNVNDAPVLPITLPVLGATDRNVPIEFAARELVAAAMDADPQDAVGAALTAVTGVGTWEFALDGQTFARLPVVSATAALLLPPTAVLRYRPNGQTLETVSVSFRAWDGTSGSAGQQVVLPLGGGTSAFSGGGDTASFDVTINTPPTFALSSNNLNFLEGDGPRAIAPAGDITDPDSANFNRGFLRASFVSGGADDRFALLPNALLSLNGPDVLFLTSRIGVLSGGGPNEPLLIRFVSDFATPAAVSSVLNAIAYRNDSQSPANGSRQVEFTVNDGDGGTATATATLTVTAIADAPQIALAATSLVYVENDAPVALAAGAGLADVDTERFIGARLTVSIISGGEAADTLAIAPGEGVSATGNTVRYDDGSGARTIGTVQGGTSGLPLVVQFDGQGVSRDAVQAVLRAVTYSVASESPVATPRVVQFVVHDGESDGNASTSVAVIAVNDAPQLALTGRVAYQENAVLLVDPLVTLSDADSPNFHQGSLAAAVENGGPDDGLLVQAGSGVLVNAQNVFFDAGNGSLLVGQLDGPLGRESLTITFNQAATPRAVQAILANLAYVNRSDNPPSSRSIRLVVDDGDGNGTVVANVFLDISTTNDPPQISLSPAPANFREGQAPVTVNAGASVTDPDSPNLGGSTFIAEVVAGGSADDQLALRAGSVIALQGNNVLFDAGSGFVPLGSFAGGDGAPLVVSLMADASAAGVTALARAVTFSNRSNAPTTDPRVVEFRATSSDGLTGSATQTVTITPVNEPPQLTPATRSVTYTENTDPIAPAGDATLTDADSRDFQGGQLTLRFPGGMSATDELTFGGSPIGRVADLVLFDDGRGSRIIGRTTVTTDGLRVDFTTPEATPAAVATLVRSMRYRDTSEAPAATPRVLEYRVTDGDGGVQTAVLSRTIQVVPVNDAPQLDASGVAATYVEGSAPVTLNGGFGVTDIDSPQFSGGRIVVGLGTSGTVDDRLAVGAVGLVTVNGNVVSHGGTVVGVATGGQGGDLTIDLGANATPALVTDVLRALTFANVSANPVGGRRAIALAVADGGGGSAMTQAAVEVVPVNQPPQIASADGVSFFVENAAPLGLAPTAVVTDPDSANFAGGTFVATITSGLSPDDRLTIVPGGSIDTQGAAVVRRVGNASEPIGTFFGGSAGSPLFVQLNERATPAALTDLIRAVAFRNESDRPATGPRVIRFDLGDGDGPAVGSLTRTIGVQATNDPPVLTGLPRGVTFVEGETPARLAPLAELRDPDSADFAGGSITVTVRGGEPSDQIVVLPRSGVSQTGNTVSVDVGGAAVSIGTIRGSTAPFVLDFTSDRATLAAVQSVLRALALTNDSPAPSTLPREIELTIVDGDRGTDSATGTVTANVVGRNEPPQFVPSAGNTAYVENGSPVAVDAALGLTDADSADFDGGLFTVSIVSGRRAGDRLGLAAESGFAVVDVPGVGRRLVYRPGAGANELGAWAEDAGGEVTVTFSSPAATPAVAEALARAVTFVHDGDAPGAVARVVRFRASDGDGGADAGEATRTVQVTAVNDAPVVTTSAGATAFREGDAPQRIDAQALVEDLDGEHFSGGSLLVSLVAGASSDDRLGLGPFGGLLIEPNGNLRFDDGRGPQVIGGMFGGGAVPLEIRFSGPAATAAVVQAVVRAVTFGNESPNPVPDRRTVEFTLRDPGGATGLARRDVTVARANTLPAVDLNGPNGEGVDFARTWTFGFGAVAVGDADLTVVDTDDPRLVSARAIVDGLRDIGQEVLAVSTIGTNLTASYFAGTGELTLTASTPQPTADFERVLRTLSYDNSAAAPTGGPRRVVVSVNDGAADSLLAVSTIATIVAGDADGIRDEVEAQAPNQGDGNRDGMKDSQQDNVASLPNPVDGQFVTIASPPGTTLVDVRGTTASPSPGDAPAGVQFRLGFFDFRVTGVRVGGAVTVSLFLPGNDANAYYLYGPTPDRPLPHWYHFAFDGTTGAEFRGNGRIDLHFVDGLRGDADLSANGTIVDPGGPSVVGTLRPWQNVANRYDVNADLFVSPVDVLQVINRLNVRGAGPLPVPPVAPEVPPPFLDVNGDNQLTALDAVEIITFLNNRARLASAEGEPTGTLVYRPAAGAGSSRPAAGAGSSLVYRPAAGAGSPSDIAAPEVPRESPDTGTPNVAAPEGPRRAAASNSTTFPLAGPRPSVSLDDDEFERLLDLLARSLAPALDLT